MGNVAMEEKRSCPGSGLRAIGSQWQPPAPLVVCLPLAIWLWLIKKIMEQALILATKRIANRGTEHQLICLDGNGLHPVRAGDVLMVGRGQGEARLLTEDPWLVAEVTNLRSGTNLEQLKGMLVVKR